MAPMIPIAMQLAQFAPGIIKLLTGSEKVGHAAEKVVGIAQALTGNGTPEGAVSAIMADPGKVLEFQQAMAAQQADLEKEYLVGIKDARSRDVELHKAGFSNHRANVMVALDAAGLVACLAVLVFYRSSLPGEVVGIVSTIAGIFGACLRDAHQFEFGSSRSSQTKDVIISQLSK
jgi:hypothetical protein